METLAYPQTLLKGSSYAELTVEDSYDGTQKQNLVDLRKVVLVNFLCAIPSENSVKIELIFSELLAVRIIWAGSWESFREVMFAL